MADALCAAYDCEPAPRPAAHRFRGMCVHEHLAEGDLCEPCAAELAACLAAGNVICGVCHDAGYDVGLTLEITPPVRVAADA